MTVDLEQGLSRIGALMRQGEPAAVEALFAELMAVHPRSAELHELLAVHLFKLGRHESARESLDRALALGAQAEMRCRLGRLLHAMGDPAGAARLFSEAKDMAPAWAEPWQLLGFVQAGLGDWQAALASLHEAHGLDPDNQDTLVRLSDLELDHGVPARSLPVMRRLAASRPGDADAQLKLGVILGRLFDHREAVAHYQDALARLPASADLWMALAQSYEYLGEREHSQAGYREALRLRAGWGLPMAGLLGLARADASDTMLLEAARIVEDERAPEGERATLAYELGKCHDAAGRYAEAMKYWRLANDLRKRTTEAFDPAQVRSLVARTLAAFGREPGREGPAGGMPACEEQLVFIVGMPRSGTTLTEQIIAAHPDAHGCGELLDLTLMANRLHDAQGRQWPEAVPDSALCARFAEAYLLSARRHAGPARVLVDKAPLNFFFLGLVARLFPTAKVIWCRREPRDVAISIYAENFSLDAPFATCLTGIAEYQAAELRLMQHWRNVLPIPVLELRYEDLVTDVQMQSRRLVEFVGLPWNEACLDFHRGAGVVQTPSRWQVRQPAHRRSVGRWRNYEGWMADYEARLRSLNVSY